MMRKLACVATSGWTSNIYGHVLEEKKPAKHAKMLLFASMLAITV